ncbi:MAG: alpha/beta hydrolase [Kribbellaceae bacterium]|nr:alpha/beta hydrolase [Kribbellaceae bacterium]
MRTNVNFTSGGLRIAGQLYVPEGNQPRPAVVVGHPGTGVKEQTAGLYARRLADQGFVTLAFDAAYQGESEGLPRGLEDPAQRVEDLKAAVSYLATRAEVEPDRIGVLGICASGGYGLVATASDPRIKALATVSAADISRQFRVGADGTQDPSVFAGLLAAAAAARTAEARGAGVQTFDLFPATEDAARAGGQHVYEGWEYYCTPRGQHERSTKSLPWVSVDRIATFDALQAVDRPLLMIAGRDAVTSWMSVEAFQRATGPKEFTWIDGASHVDLYDREEYVTPAVARISAFFTESLG